MKTKTLNLILGMMLIGITTVFAAEAKTEKFKVYGNCGMCEDRIEKAVTDMTGVTAAAWDSKTKMIEVTFDESKVEVAAIHKAIAKVGHDTEIERAEDKVYKALHGCCQYDRKDAAKDCDHKTKEACNHKGSKKGKSCCKH
jgi:periplasmic mercuric ion binding protein